MEQPPNMLPNGMQNMNMNSMQRAQQGNAYQQMHAKVLDDIKRNPAPLPHGWQTTFDPNQRVIQVLQIITHLRMLQQDATRCVAIAENFELKSIQESATKEEYHQRIKVKLQEIDRHRDIKLQQSAQNGQLGPPMNNMQNNNMMIGNANMNMMQNQGGAGMGMNMGMNGNMNMNMGGNMNMNQGQGMDMSNMAMGMPNGQMAMNGLQQNHNFPAQLQKQMQPSPLPQQLQAMQQNNTMDPAALQNPQMQPQMPNMNSQAPNTNQNGNTFEPSQAQIKMKMAQIMATLTEAQKEQMRSAAYKNLTEQQIQQHRQSGADPVTGLIYGRARLVLIKQAAAAAGATQQSGNSIPMQSMSMNNNGVPQTSQPDFSTITGLQANAIRSQESGGEVVPASNHQSFNMGGQMNVAQGVNPQMLGNQNQQTGNNPNMAQMKMAQLQRQQQAQQQLQKDQQNQLAQRQALAAQQTQNHLRGQPGGLSTPNALNGGQINSPAMNMSMLNRPMAPPGQGTPSTPQQPRPGQGVPQTPMNAVNQLAQHHQSMMNQGQNNQSMQGNRNTMERLIGMLPPDRRAQVANMNPAELQAFIPRFVAAQAQQQREANNAQANAQAMMNMAQNQNMGGSQQQMMGNGVPQNIGNAIPNFTSQPPPNQQQTRPPQDQTIQSMKVAQGMAMKQRALDSQQYPKHILTTLGLQVNPSTDTWGKLKHFIIQNQAVLPPGTLEKLNQTQLNWFETHPEDVQKAVQEFGRKMQAFQQRQALHAQQQQMQAQQNQQPQPHVTQPATSMAMQNGQAPPAQMVPPVAPMMQPPNQNPNMGIAPGQVAQQQIPQVSDAEVRAFRQKTPNAVGASDDQIRGVIMKQKRQTFLLNAQNRTTQANAPRPGNMSQGDQQQPARMQQGQNQATMATAQGQKRPQTSNDDVIEIKNPATAAANSVPQAAPMQQTPSQQGRMPQMRQLTQEQFNNLNPAQKQAYQNKLGQIAQMAALRKANQVGQNTVGNQAPPQPQIAQQQPQGAPSQAQLIGDQQKLDAMWTEVSQNTLKGPPAKIEDEEIDQAMAIFKKLWRLMSRVDTTYRVALHSTGIGEQRLRQMMRYKVIISQQVQEEAGDIRIKGYISLPLNELKSMAGFCSGYFNALQSAAMAKRNQQGQGQANVNGAQVQQPPQQPPQVAKQETVQQAPPLNRKVSQTGHGRKQSSSTKAPPAPTDEKKFDWGAPSPHGIPKYESGRSELTPDKLKFPPQKKRKTGESLSQTSTPVPQVATPNGNSASPGQAAVKAPTPEQVRRMQAQVKAAQPAAPKFRCDDMQCDASITGFETEEALKQHKENEHQLIEDPFKYLMESSNAYLESEKKAAAPAKAQVLRGKGAPVEKPKQQQKSATGTPAPGARGVSRPATTPASKQTTDAQPTVEAAPPQEKTLMESMAENLNFELPTRLHAPATGPTSEEMWVDNLNSNFIGSEAAAYPWDDLQAGTDWRLPQDLFDSDASSTFTPESTDSQSSRDSDVSRNANLAMNMTWDAWGNGDAGAPDVLSGLDELTFDNVVEGEGMDWSGDVDQWNLFLNE